MATDDTEIVSTLRAAVADKVGKERFELWFGTSTKLALDGDTLSVIVPNHFFHDWLRANFRRHIEGACRESLGHCPRLEFRVDPSLSTSDNPTSDNLTSSDPLPNSLAVSSTGGDETCQPAKPVGAATNRAFLHPIGSELPNSPLPGIARPRKFADLDSFVEGESNRLAKAAAEMAARRPGDMSPLLIHGPTGVGKTHLLEGIWTAARRNRRITVIYLTAEQFTNGFLQALRGSGLPSFRRKYRGVDLLLVDDLQFFTGKRHTQIELSYTIDTLLRAGRQLAFGADRPLAELSDFIPELTTRLQSGMICRIDPPDYATRSGIVDQMARRIRLKVPAEVKQFIAGRLTSHARELSGALCLLEATAKASGKPITLDSAEQALAELIRSSSRVVRLADVEKAVCSTFGLEPSTLQSNRKTKRVNNPRTLAMWLARKYTRSALSEISSYFGRRSHSTVISAQKRVDTWIAEGTTLQLADHTWTVEEAIQQVERCLKTG